ncbi:MAG: hypothetical protein ACSW77_06415 [Bacteroidales bacterium]
MENKKEKRVVQIEIDDNVKKLTITGEDKDQQVVMKEELDDDKLDQVAGGEQWCYRQGRCPRLH